MPPIPFRTILLFSLCFGLLFSCRLPEDLRKKPEESLQRLREEGAQIREFHFLEDEVEVYGVASACELKNQNILIFIHGSPGGWQNYTSYLGDKILTSSFCILSVDRPGFGKSSPDQSLPDIERQAYILGRAISQFQRTVGNEKNAKIVLVGHSYGGPIAARIASFPDLNIAGLLLLAAALSGEAEEVRWYNRVADWNWIKRILPREINHSNSEMLPLKKQLFDLTPHWKEIQCKTILIHGKEDSLVPYRNLEYFQTQLSKTILKTIPLEEENHFIPWTQKELIRKLLLEFLD